MCLVHHRGDFLISQPELLQNYIENRDTQMNTLLQLQKFLQKLIKYTLCLFRENLFTQIFRLIQR